MSRSTHPRSRGRVALAAALLAAALLTQALAAAAAVASATPKPVLEALDYVASCQRTDGGFAEKSASASSDALTAWTIVALASADQDPNSWRSNGRSPVDFLATRSGDWRTVTDYARTAIAARAAGKDPSSFGGVDLIARIRASRTDHGSSGDSFGPYVNTHVWALLALESAGESVTDREVSWLVGQQNSDGGWGWAPTVASDSNDTAAAIQSLVACGIDRGSDTVKRGLAYLHTKKSSSGGFGYTASSFDANSTSWAIQALASAGQDTSSARAALRTLQAEDGSVRYTSGSKANPLLVTVQAIPALASRPFPLAVRAKAAAFRAQPRVRLVAPASGSVVASGAAAVVRLSVTDGGTGIAPATLKVLVDGRATSAKLVGSTARVSVLGLAPGAHSVVASVADRAGNAVRTSRLAFTVAAASSATATGSATATSALTATAAPAAAASAAAAALAAAGTPADGGAASGSRATPAGAEGWSPLGIAIAVLVGALVPVAGFGGYLLWRRRRGASPSV